MVAQITRMVIEKAQRETRFTARAARVDSTVVEADVLYPSDAVLALQGRGAKAKLRAAATLEELAQRCGKVAEQIDHYVRGLKITDQLVSIADRDARPIRKGKLGEPTEANNVVRAPHCIFVFCHVV